MSTNRLPTTILLVTIAASAAVIAAQNVPLGEAIRNRNVQVYRQMNLDSLPSPAAQGAEDKKFFEGHWHGLELIRLSRELRQEYDIPVDVQGLLIDEVTLEATQCGFLAGDVVQSVDGYSTLTLKDFLKASMKAQNQTETKILVYRSSHAQALSGDIGIVDFKARAQAMAAPQQSQHLTLVLRIADYYNNLGYANMDAAPPIQPGAISPHKDRGRKCADCHVFMNTGGQLAVDAGDIVPNPPAIQQGSKRPHEDRGQCNFCHRIIDPQNPNTLARGNAPSAPTIVKGAVCPHDFRGECILCHRVVNAQNPVAGAPGQPVTPGPLSGIGAAYAAVPQIPADSLSARNQGVLADSQTQMPDSSTITAQAGPIDPQQPSQQAGSAQGPRGIMWLGVEAVSVTPEMAYQLGLAQPSGVFIYNLQQNSPFRYVGLKRGDVIVSLDNTPIQDADQFNSLVVGLKPVDRVGIGVIRQGKERAFHYTLSRPFRIPKLGIPELGIPELGIPELGIPELSGNRRFTMRAVGIAVVLAFVYFLVFNNILGRTVSFALGAVLVIVMGYRFEFFNFFQALRAINYNVLMFIVGMNCIIAVLHETGFFENLGGRIVARTRGDRATLFVLFCLLTFALAAVLENIAVILVVVPLTLRLAKSLRFDPKPLVIAVIISSNIGGASTMIGDIPNLLIALSTNLRFMDFIIYLMPVCILLMGAMFVYMRFAHSTFFMMPVRKREDEYEGGDKDWDWVKPIVNVKATTQALVVLGIAIVGMIIAAQLAGFIALAGGIAILILGGVSREKILKHAGWSDVVFFACLFIVVGAFQASGFLYFFAHEVVLRLSMGNPLAIAIIILLLAAVVTAFMNAGPTTAMFIPVVGYFGAQAPNNLFWWALSLGVLCGSSASLYGASGGPLASSILAKYWRRVRHHVDADSPFAGLSQNLDMREYLRTGIPIMGIFVAISVGYVSVLHFFF